MFDVTEEVRRIISETIHNVIPPRGIHPDDYLTADLCLIREDIETIKNRLEERFNIKFDITEFIASGSIIETVGDVIALVEKKIRVK